MAALKPISPIGGREPKLLTIGQVLNLLRGEFRDLTNSKLRFSASTTRRKLKGSTSGLIVVGIARKHG